MPKYICVANCPELDYDDSPHCTCANPTDNYEQYADGCPCGNVPKWVEIGGD